MHETILRVVNTIETSSGIRAFFGISRSVSVRSVGKIVAFRFYHPLFDNFIIAWRFRFNAPLPPFPRIWAQ